MIKPKSQKEIHELHYLNIFINNKVNTLVNLEIYSHYMKCGAILTF